MPEISANVRSFPGIGAAISAIRRGERLPYLGLASQHRRLPRGRTLAIAGVVAFACSVWLRIVIVSAHPQQLWLTVDLDVYYEAGRSLPHGEAALYSSGFGLGGFAYLYPPLTALVFEHLSSVSFDEIRMLMATVSIGCLVAVAWSAWGLLGYRPGFGRCGATAAVAAVGLWLEPVNSNLGLGQVNVLIMALVIGDLALSDRRWAKGVGIGLATAIKLTPGLFVVYLLLTRRIRAAVVAVGTFAAVTGGVWLVLPKASRDFWFHAIGVSPPGHDYAANQSLQGMFLRLLNNSDSAAKYPWLLASALIALAGLAAATLAANRGAELLGALVVAVVALEVSPISWTNHWVWFEPLIVLAAHTALSARRRSAGVWAAVGTIAALAWPARVGVDGGSDPKQPLLPTGLINYAPRSQGREEAWDPFQILLGNAYVICGAAFVATVVVLEWRRLRRLTRDSPDPADASAPAPQEPEALGAPAAAG